MKNNLSGFNRIVSFTISISAVCLLTIACASKPSFIVIHESDAGAFQNLVHGKLVSADNQPLKGITVFFPKSLGDENKPITDLSLNSAVEQSMGCKLPTQPYSSFACTDAFGNFTIAFVSANQKNFELKFQHNNTTIHTELSLNDLDSDLGTITFADDNNPQKKKIAIVLDLQGEAAQMSNSLEDTIPNTMKVEFEQEFSKMYDIDENEFDVEFLPFPSLFEDKNADNHLDIFDYKIIYLITPGNEDLSDLSKENKLTLLDYISKGGELFVTSLSVEAEDASLEDYI